MTHPARHDENPHPFLLKLTQGAIARENAGGPPEKTCRAPLGFLELSVLSGAVSDMDLWRVSRQRNIETKNVEKFLAICAMGSDLDTELVCN